MLIWKLTPTPINFGLDVNIHNLDYTVRFASDVEDYSISFSLFYSNESLISSSNSYRVLYISTVDNDSNIYRLRYEANVELITVTQDFRVLYQSEPMALTHGNYRIKYDSEGIEAYESKKIFRIYYENESINSIRNTYSVRYLTESSDLYTMDFTVSYSSETTREIFSSVSVLKDMDNNDYLLIGIYSKKSTLTDIYTLITSLPSYMLIEYSSTILDYPNIKKYDPSVFELIDIDSRIAYDSYTPQYYLLVSGIKVTDSISVDIYESYQNTIKVNENKTYNFNPDINSGFIPHEFEVDGIYFTYKNIYDMKTLNNLNTVNHEIGISLEVSEDGCCFSKKVVSSGTNTCTP